MRPAPFDYAEPDTVDEACALLAERDDEAVVLAGGQSLVAQLNAREVRPALVVGIRRLTELDAASKTGDTVAIGARITQRAWQRHPLAAAAPLVLAALEHVGHVPTRNRGTLGGSIALADPAAELPTALLALDGAVRLRSSSGERTVRAADFFLAPFRSARRPDELLTALEIPTSTAGRRWVFEQRHYRRHGKVSVAAVAAADGAAVTVAIGGLGATPVRLPIAGDVSVEAAVAMAGDLLVPGTDHLAGEAHRRALLAATLTAALTTLRHAAAGRAA